MIAEGAEWFDGVSREHMAIVVDIHPAASVDVIGVPAVIGRSTFDALTNDGMTIRFETRDFSISTVDWAVAPKKGDRIIETDRTGTRREYEACVPAGMQSCWHWADSAYRKRRIHTQLVENA